MGAVITVPAKCDQCGCNVDTENLSITKEYHVDATLYLIRCPNCGSEFDQFWVKKEW